MDGGIPDAYTMNTFGFKRSSLTVENQSSANTNIIYIELDGTQQL